MFGGELVQSFVPRRAGITPLVRDVDGPGAHSQGIIAKEPGSTWFRRKQLLDRRHAEEVHKVTESNIKDVVVIARQMKFEQKTERRNFLARLQVGVQDGLQAADEDLKRRQNILRDLLLREEHEYTRGCVEQSLSVKNERLEEVKMRLEELRSKNEAAERQFVEEKRIQQYKARCEELRMKVFEHNRRKLNDVHKQQMEEKLAQKHAERERDVMFYNLMVKDLEAMEEYESRRNNINKAVQRREIKDVYEKTMEGKRLMAEEEKRIKLEEAKLINLLKEEIAKEKKEEWEEKKKQKEKLQVEVMQQVKQSRELLDWKKKQERDMDNAFCKLIQDELDREKAKSLDTKKQNRRELELFQAYFNRLKSQQIKDEKEAEELRSRDMKKINDLKDEARCATIRAKQRLLEEVIEVQGLQMEEKKERLQEEYEQKKIEEDLILKEIEQFKIDEAVMKQQRKMKCRLMAKELKDHGEAIQALRAKEKADEESSTNAKLMAEEQYLRTMKSKEIACDLKHPFYKVFEGTGH